MNALILLLLGLACRPEPATETGEAADPRHPRDGELGIADLQAVGTHNSYHVETTPLGEWRYTHPPLPDQLDAGARHFELDLRLRDGAFEVFHIPDVDAGTTCLAFADCLGALAGWSDAHPGHHPVMLLLEPKDEPDATGPWIEALGLALAEGLGDRVIQPSEVRGASPTLADAVGERGWPTFETTRGRFLAVLHEHGPLRATLLDTDWDGPQPALFADGGGDFSLRGAAFHTLNDPDDPRIAEALEAGLLVRTRADSGLTEALANDPSRAALAWDSGAHFVSTDFLVAHPETGYAVAVPGGQPSRCNPRVAPSDCGPTDIEDPSRLR